MSNIYSKKKILFLIVLIFISVNLSLAQYSDTSFFEPDTVTLQKSEINHSKENIWISAGVPSLMITYGIFSFSNKELRKIDNNTHNTIHRGFMTKNHLDDYLQFSPAVAAFTMKLAGVESRHNLFEMGVMYALSNVLQSAIISTVKGATKRIRPDNSNNFSFPSGHAAVAFLAAEFLHQEYKDHSIWISVGGYAMASLIGISRVLNDKHWVSDVIAGAGIGIISTKIVYWTYPYMQKMFSRKKTKRAQTFVIPSYNNKVFGLNISYRF